MENARKSKTHTPTRQESKEKHTTKWNGGALHK